MFFGSPVVALSRRDQRGVFDHQLFEDAAIGRFSAYVRFGSLVKHASRHGKT